MSKKIIVLSLFWIVFSVFFIRMVIAPFAYPEAVGTDIELRTQTCRASDSTSQFTYDQDCAGPAYPAACGVPIDGFDGVSCDDNEVEDQSLGNNQFGGVELEWYNSTIFCDSIINVELCFEWWTDDNAPDMCSIGVDANNGSSYTEVSTQCPATSPNPGVTCINVTASETWTCDNFFGTNEDSRSKIRNNARRPGGGAANALNTDLLSFNVTFVEGADTTPPEVTITFPENRTYSSTNTPLNFTATLNEDGDTVFYSFDEGVNNITMVTGDNREYSGVNDSVPNGGIRLRIFANDTDGNRNDTTFVDFHLDTTIPLIEFIPPTPNNASTQSENFIYVNVSSTDATTHYTFTEFDGDLFLWMRMDEDNGTHVTDLSSESNNGTIIRNAFNNDSGRFGDAFDFDGVNALPGDGINITGLAGDKRFNESFSVSVWIQPRSTNNDILGTANNLIINPGWRLFIDTQGDVTFQGNDSTFGALTVAESPHTSPPNIFTHVVMVYNKSAPSIELYLNGSLVLTETATASSSGYGADNVGFAIGDINSGNAIWDGLIDEVILINRSLSAGEASALFNASATQYENNFTNLSETEHTFTSYTVDDFGNRNATNPRLVTISAVVANQPPTVSNVLLNASTNDNLTEDNLTVFFDVTDAEFNATFNNTDWRVENISIALFNMPFNVNISTTDTGAIQDYSSFANNGTLEVGAPNSLIWTSEGKVGGGYLFDGSDTPTKISLSLPINLTEGDGFTFMAWVLRQNDAPAGQNIFSNGQFFLRMAPEGEDPDNPFQGFVTIGGGSDPRVTSNALIHVGQWIHVAVTWDEIDLKIFVNGTLDNTQARTGEINATFISPRIGCCQLLDLGGNTWNGTIDEVLLFNRSLSAEQILVIYDAGMNNISVNTIVSQETVLGDNWTVSVTASDLVNDSLPVLSNNVEILAGVVDTCTYTGGNYDVDCGDNCRPTSNIVIDTGFNVTISGEGTYILDGVNLTGFTHFNAVGISTTQMCVVTTINGGSIIQ